MTFHIAWSSEKSAFGKCLSLGGVAVLLAATSSIAQDSEKQGLTLESSAPATRSVLRNEEVPNGIVLENLGSVLDGLSTEEVPGAGVSMAIAHIMWNAKVSEEVANQILPKIIQASKSGEAAVTAEKKSLACTEQLHSMSSQEALRVFDHLDDINVTVLEEHYTTFHTTLSEKERKAVDKLMASYKRAFVYVQLDHTNSPSKNTDRAQMTLLTYCNR